MPQESLRAVTGFEVSTTAKDQSAPSSPGQLLSHYAPNTPIRINAERAGEESGVLAFGDNNLGHKGEQLNLSPSEDLVEAAANLFAYLHELDQRPISEIVAVPIPNEGLGRAINDRLQRAAEPQ